MRTLALTYGHHETHGPQICAIEMLSKHCDKVDVIFSNVAETTWQFPNNVKLFSQGKFIPQDLIYKKNPLGRLLHFFNFVYKVFAHLRINKYDLIVIYNPPAFWAISILFNFISRKTLIWYHNYDPIDINKTKKYSQAWFAFRAMNRKFPKIDFFSLPEESRKIFYPVNLLRNQYFILPNYSMLELHEAKKREIENEKVRLVFAGVISEGNGLEQIIELLKFKIEGKSIELVLKGFLKEEYKNQLIKLANDVGVEDKLIILPVGPWKGVPEITRTCHIGIHILTKDDIISKTMGKGGSGKIFQYIGEGLPVLMSPAFHENFKEYDWAISTKLDYDSLVSNISFIIRNFDNLSNSAILSFKEELNCNIYFDKIFKSINQVF